MEKGPVVSPDHTKHAFAEPGSALDNDVKNWLSIRGRAADGVQYGAGRGLVFECFGHLTLLRLQLIKQSNVLYRDYGLVSESRSQRDLCVGERTHISACKNDHADRGDF